MKEIALTQGKFALVDDEDFDRLNQFKWCAHNHTHTFYAERWIRNDNPPPRGRIERMARVITNCPEPVMVDHINGNGLDNRKENLCIVTKRGNMQNLHTRKTSTTPGSHFNTRRNKWVSKIFFKNKVYYLGQFDSEYDAGIAYKVACEALHV